MRTSRVGLNPYKYFLRNPPPNIPREVVMPPTLGTEDPRFTIKTPSMQCLPNPLHMEVSTRSGTVVPMRARMPRPDGGFLLAVISERCKR